MLFETKTFLWFVFPSVVVYVKDENKLVERIMKRDNVKEDDARKIISQQMPVELKLKKAEISVDNSGPPEALYTAFYAKYSQAELFL